MSPEVLRQLDELVGQSQPRPLPEREGLDPSVHVFDQVTLDALRTALVARRPLLVRGEPGTGKSQLARAAAEVLGRLFVWTVVDARTESRDLHWTYDAVARLAEAQVLGATEKNRDTIRRELRQERFLAPGPLWWAFDWKTAVDQAKEAGAVSPEPPPGWTPEAGAVVLVDEIDKADSAVPNGLLESLGHGRFACPGGRIVKRTAGRPLVIVTTNEERALPDAFLRRCLVLHLGWPDDQESFRQKMVERGRAHFPACRQDVQEQVADRLFEERRLVVERGLSPPGGAEFLDILRALDELAPGDAEAQKKLLARLATFALEKHPPER